MHICTSVVTILGRFLLGIENFLRSSKVQPYVIQRKNRPYKSHGLSSAFSHPAVPPATDLCIKYLLSVFKLVLIAHLIASIKLPSLFRMPPGDKTDKKKSREERKLPLQRTLCYERFNYVDSNFLIFFDKLPNSSCIFSFRSCFSGLRELTEEKTEQ